jgi:ABC-2 type transport system ATP-binding protein
MNPTGVDHLSRAIVKGMIKAQNLSKTYKNKLAVDDVSFEVELGKVTGFLGPNGAGKSTTMRLMLGLDKGSGETTFDGKHLQDYSQPSTIVGTLLEMKAFHPTRSARNHLRVLTAAGGIDDSRIDEVLEIVGLTEVANKAPGKFSLGMSQRLGIAAAMLGDPKYLILDEPANGLDPEGIAWLREFLKAYADKGNAVFVSSHLLSEMAQMADNIVVIGRGKLIASTSIDSLVTGSSRSGVLVRVATKDNAKLKAGLRKKLFKFVTDDAGLHVHGVSTDEVGRLAFASGVAVLELTKQNASLEEAFLQLTGDSEEYKTVAMKGEKA